jgi:iron complex transport system ATP-binding protein
LEQSLLFWGLLCFYIFCSKGEKRNVNSESSAVSISWRHPGIETDQFYPGSGEFLAVLGNNGAGKSTMLKCFNGIIKPDRGEIFLDQENLLKMPAKEAAKRIAFVAQNVPNTQMTVYDMVMLGRRPYMRFGFSKRDHEIVGEVMEKLNIFDFRGRFLNG